MNTALHFSSGRQDWETPQDFFEECSRRFGPFDLDVCACESNKKCALFLSPEQDQDGLVSWWFGRCWCNPPYKDTAKWLEKARREISCGRAKSVTALIASRTDTRMWHEHIMRPGNKIYFIRGRLRFGGSKDAAPFPSAVAHMTNGDFSPEFYSMDARRG